MSVLGLLPLVRALLSPDLSPPSVALAHLCKCLISSAYLECHLKTFRKIALLIACLFRLVYFFLSFSRSLSYLSLPISPTDSLTLSSSYDSSRTRSYTSSSVTGRLLDRSTSHTSSYGNSSSTSGLASNRYDRSISLSSTSGASAAAASYLSTTSSSRLDTTPTSSSFAVASSKTNTDTPATSATTKELYDDDNDTYSIATTKTTTTNTEPETDSLSTLDDSSQNPGVMDSLQVPGMGDPQNRQQNPQQNPQFSEAFTDHCDQYKSVTSKILGKKGGNQNRNSGEFGDVHNELSQHLEQDQQFQQLQQQQQQRQLTPSPSFDEFGNGKRMLLCYYVTISLKFLSNLFIWNTEYPSEQRQLTPEQKHQDPYLEEKKVLENQLFNSPSASRVTSRNNSLAFDSFGSPSSSRKNSNTNLAFDPFTSGRPAGQTSRRNSASAATSASRKGSLPSDYLAHPDTFALSNDWSREKVANLAHEARQRAHNPRGNDSLKKVGVSPIAGHLLNLI